MNLLRYRLAAATCTALLLISAAPAQDQAGDKVDLNTLTQIKHEAFQNSHVIPTIFSWVVIAAGLVMMSWPLRYLREAEAARSGRRSRFAKVLAAYVTPTLAVALIALAVINSIDAHTFVHQANHTTAAYTELDGWSEEIGECTSFSELPTAAQEYMRFIGEHVGVPVALIGVGPGRDQVVWTELGRQTLCEDYEGGLR